MARAQVRVRDADARDLAMLPDWWEDIRASGARMGPFAPPVLDDRLRERIEAMHADPSHRLLVVESDGQPVGLAVLCREPLSPVSDTETVQIAFMHVRDGARRRGAGRALVAAAADFAAEVGAGFVTVAAQPQSRDANRFYARLGFSPVVVRRAVATSALQRRLSGRAGPVRHLAVRRRIASQRMAERTT